GNPLALLNPKLCPVKQSAEHLMTLAWQHALNHYQKFKAFRPIQVNQLGLKNPEQLLGLADEYPEEILAVQDTESQELQTAFPSLKLLEAGAVSPHQLREEILLHPHIQYQQAKISHIEAATKPQLFSDEQDLGEFDHVIVCTARETAQFFADYPALK
ncbi:FAD-dependent cmnm(5)s(2)U34 oxidoreductase, partial [Yersinia pestis]